MHSCLASAVGVFALAAVGLHTPASAVALKAQAPCATSGPDSSCKNFSRNSTFPFTVRAYLFDMPKAGAAEVSFHGSLVCTNVSINSPEWISLSSQITGASTAIPHSAGAGGLSIFMTLYPHGTFGISDTFNLTSTRVISYAAGGPKAVYFSIATSRFDPDISCSVFNAAFTVLITP